jgi:hypothetical protein
MKKDIAALLAFVVVITATNCTGGHKLSFGPNPDGPNYATINSATIVFQDKRKKILSAEEKSSFYGYNNTSRTIKKMETRNDKPLADEFAGHVKTSYNRTGSSANTTFVNSDTKTDSILEIFVVGNKLRLLLFTIKEWECKALPLYSRTRYEVVYSLELKVYNKNCDLLTTNAINNVFAAEEEASFSNKKMRLIAENVFKEQVRLLFSKTSVRQNL